KLDFAAAIEACDQNKGPVMNILRSGLQTTERGNFNPDKIDQAFNEAASVELARPFVFVNYLQVIASVSPMVGLLGTVSGMVKAFRTISEQGMGRPELLANNISEALVTTASGLMVAIPALIAYFFFKNKYGKIAASVSQVLGRILRDVTDRHENPSDPSA
ncbi:MAG: biopolymer transport protein ExbB, partial [Lentimonas sp.]